MMGLDHLASESASAPIGQAAVEDAATLEWCIVEIFGHRRHAGRGREEERFGSKMLRIDVPTVTVFERVDPDAPATKLDPPKVEWVTHYYGGASIFSFTLTDEATVMGMNRPYHAPSRLSLPAPQDDDEFSFEEDDAVA